MPARWKSNDLHSDIGIKETKNCSDKSSSSFFNWWVYGPLLFSQCSEDFLGLLLRIGEQGHQIGMIMEAAALIGFSVR